MPSPFKTTFVICFCEQTHAACQGYSSEDHVSKDCHTVTPDPEQLVTICELLEQVEVVSNRKQQAAVDLWAGRHPEVTECLCEGEDFIGLKWVEHSKYESEDADDHTPADKIIERLRGMVGGESI